MISWLSKAGGAWDTEWRRKPWLLMPSALGAFRGSRTYLDAGIPSIMASDHGVSSERSFAGCSQDGQVGAVNGVRNGAGDKQRGPHLSGGMLWKPLAALCVKWCSTLHRFWKFWHFGSLTYYKESMPHHSFYTVFELTAHFWRSLPHPLKHITFSGY